MELLLSFWYPKWAKSIPSERRSRHSTAGVIGYVTFVGVAVGVREGVGVLVCVAVGVVVTVGVAVGVGVGGVNKTAVYECMLPQLTAHIPLKLFGPTRDVISG
jgi:hypothetical protein